MKAQILPASAPESIRLAGETIRMGGLVAFPTETVYGLGCDALNPDAAAKVFEPKQRPQFDPLIVHIADRRQLDNVVRALTTAAWQLIDQFWPGPLTLVWPKQPTIPDLVTAGLDTVAVRMPNHPVAQALIREAGTPIAAPSANPFGYVSPTRAQHVSDGLGSAVDLILDGGPCPVGVESTIVSLIGPQAELLRPGSITLEQLSAVIGPLSRSSSVDFRPTEVETLLGDASKAKDKLGWTPKISFAELVAEMVREDLKSAERDELVKKHGYAAYEFNE